MTPQSILIALWNDGIGVRLSSDGENLTVPAGRLTPDQRAIVLTHKSALTKFLHASHATTIVLLEAAMKVCDQHGDGESARIEMRQQCLELPPHLRTDLLDHFRKTYGIKP